MDVEFNWKLTTKEKKSILSRMEEIFNIHNLDQFIFKSPMFSDDQHKSGTKWFLEITSGKDYYIQLKLCLADVEKFAHMRVTYKVVLKTRIERASFVGDEVFDPKKICKTIHAEKFINAHYFEAFILENFELMFLCSINIQVLQVTNNYLSFIQTDYEKLLNDTKYSDFSLVTSTKKFSVHKTILAARSEVFAAMFEHDMKETKEGFAEIKEFNDKVVQEFLRFIYCAKVENVDTLAKNLLVAAEKYLMFDLKVLCLEEICKHISIENALELLVLVDNHNVEHLRSSVMDFIVQNIKDSTIKSNLDAIDNGKLSNEILRRTVNKYL